MFDNDSNEKLKILLISPLPSNSSFGGIGIWTARFVHVLEKNPAVQVKVVNSIPVDKKGNDIARSKNVFKKLACNFRVLKRVKKELAAFRPDIVHLNSSCTALACARDYFFMKAIQKKKSAIVLHCHSNVADQIDGSRFGTFFLKKNIRKASAVFALNRSSHIYVKGFEKGQTKVFIVPNFLEASSVSKGKQINEDIKNVVFVGHLVKQKGIEEIISVANSFPEVHFKLVAGYTEEYPQGTAFPPNVEITGTLSVDEVFRALDQSDVFLFPTHSEGFSIALLEAMARGLPAIASNVGANADMLEKKGGIIVSSLSNDQLKNALLILKERKTREIMSRWNIDKVKSAYTADVVAQGILDIYYSLLPTKKS